MERIIYFNGTSINVISMWNGCTETTIADIKRHQFPIRTAEMVRFNGSIASISDVTPEGRKAWLTEEGLLGNGRWLVRLNIRSSSVRLEGYADISKIRRCDQVRVTGMLRGETLPGSGSVIPTVDATRCKIIFTEIRRF